MLPPQHAPLLAQGGVRGLKGHRWLVAACETKILMLDLASRATRELPRSLLDGRAPTALAFLYKCSPLLLGAHMFSDCCRIWRAPVKSERTLPLCKSSLAAPSWPTHAPFRMFWTRQGACFPSSTAPGSQDAHTSLLWSAGEHKIVAVKGQNVQS